MNFLLSALRRVKSELEVLEKTKALPKTMSCTLQPLSWGQNDLSTWNKWFVQVSELRVRKFTCTIVEPAMQDTHPQTYTFSLLEAFPDPKDCI